MLDQYTNYDIFTTKDDDGRFYAEIINRDTEHVACVTGTCETEAEAIAEAEAIILK